MTEHGEPNSLHLPEEVNSFNLPPIILEYILSKFNKGVNIVKDGWSVEQFISGNTFVPGSVILIDKPKNDGTYVGYEILINPEENNTERRSIIEIGGNKRLPLFDLLISPDDNSIQFLDQSPSVEQP